MEKDNSANSSDTSIEKEGVISQSLSKDGISNQSLANDHIGIENISVEPSKLYEAVSALKITVSTISNVKGAMMKGQVKILLVFITL